jgi:hypothetical protein
MEDNDMKARLTSVLLILAIIVTALLTRIMGNSDYILAHATNFAYKFFYCPYNRAPFNSHNYPYNVLYRGYPSMRFPYPYQYPLPKQYPCPCNVPPLLLDDG